MAGAPAAILGQAVSSRMEAHAAVGGAEAEPGSAMLVELSRHPELSTAECVLQERNKLDLLQVTIIPKFSIIRR